MNEQNIVFFDGHCNLCNASVDLLIRLDRKRIFYYAPLSGKTSERFELWENHSEDQLSIIYYKDQEHIYRYSDAVIEIATDIFPFGKIFYLFKIIPRFIRNFFYHLIAKNRYALFGKRKTCRIPTAEEAKRFLP